MEAKPQSELTARCLLLAVGAALEVDDGLLVQLEAEARAEPKNDADVIRAFVDFSRRVKELDRAGRV